MSKTAQGQNKTLTKKNPAARTELSLLTCLTHVDVCLSDVGSA